MRCSSPPNTGTFLVEIFLEASRINQNIALSGQSCSRCIHYFPPIKKVIEVPIEQCSNLTGCLSCVVNVNPLCGWCTVEQKCSRRSQCQKSTKETSWIQDDSNQCHTNVTAAVINDSKIFTYTSVIPTNTIPS